MIRYIEGEGGQRGRFSLVPRASLRIRPGYAQAQRIVAHTKEAGRRGSDQLSIQSDYPKEREVSMNVVHGHCARLDDHKKLVVPQ